MYFESCKTNKKNSYLGNEPVECETLQLTFFLKKKKNSITQNIDYTKKRKRKHRNNLKYA